MENGFKYIISKEGLLKLVAMFFGCITFALLADSKAAYTSELKWVLAAFIIAFSISTLFYFFRVIKLSDNMNCGGPCSYDGFDFIWAWFSTPWCLAGAFTFALNFPSSSYYKYGECIASIIFAFLTCIMYGVEAFFLRLYAPKNIGYVATLPGWLKTALVAFGAATFGLMVDSGFNWCKYRSCSEAGIDYALSVFVIAWGITTIMWIAHLVAPKGSIEGTPALKNAEFIWAFVGILFFFSGASVFAGYMDCNKDQIETNPNCQKRVSGISAGFLTGALYCVEAYVLWRQRR